MKKNYYYLIVGFLIILMEIPRTLNGLEDTMTFHIVGVENLVIGLALIIMAFQKNREKVTFTAWLMIAILFARWTIISLFSVSSGDFMILVVDTVAIFVLVALLFLGTKVKKITTQCSNLQRHSYGLTDNKFSYVFGYVV